MQGTKGALRADRSRKYARKMNNAQLPSEGRGLGETAPKSGQRAVSDGSRNDARKVDRGQLPIADKFEVEEFHCLACTEFIGSVVTDLYDVTGFIPTNEDRLRLLHLPAIFLNGANWIVVYERSFE